MPKTRTKNHNSQPVTEAKLEDLLSEQTPVILEAVDKRLSAQEVRSNERLESRLAAQEIRFNAKLEKLEGRFMQKLVVGYFDSK